MAFDYFTPGEAEQYAFYRVPKLLITGEQFKTLSMEAKLLYGILLDRVSLSLKSQLKAIYKDNADTIVGNMDSQIFLGGSEPSTLKDLAEALGKETIDTYNTGESRGREQSHSLNYQKLGKELMTRDELAVMEGSKCILQLRGVRPFISDKYDLTQHPNFKYTSDADKKNLFDVEKFMDHKLKLKANEEYEVVNMG